MVPSEVMARIVGAGPGPAGPERSRAGSSPGCSSSRALGPRALPGGPAPRARRSCVRRRCITGSSGGTGVLRRHRGARLRVHVARRAALLPARSRCSRARSSGSAIPAHAAVVIVSNVSALVAGVLLVHPRPARDPRHRARGARHLVLRARARRVRPRHGLHGVDDDRARDRHVPGVAGEAVVDRRRDRRARRPEPAVGLPARAPSAHRGGAGAQGPPGQGVRRPRRRGDRARASARSSTSAWVGNRFGDMWLPYSIQTEAGAAVRSRTRSTPSATRCAASGTATPSGPGSTCRGWCSSWCCSSICFRTWPASYGAYAAVSILAAVVSSNLDSFERYALGAFPLILVVASLTSSRRVERRCWCSRAPQ